MKSIHFRPQFQNVIEGTTLSVDMQQLIMPQNETNTSEGCEYLDNNIRMKEQPYEKASVPDKKTGRSIGQ